jgi:hypothetical protein
MSNVLLQKKVPDKIISKTSKGGTENVHAIPASLLEYGLILFLFKYLLTTLRLSLLL